MGNSVGFFTLCKLTSQKMRGKWGTLIGGSVCYNLIMGSGNQFAGFLAAVLLAPLTAGMNKLSLSAMQEKEIKFGILFNPFNEYGRYVWGVLRPALFTMLWTLLFIVPGIIAALRYSQTLFLMVDDPSLDAESAMKRSCELVKGAKWRLFGYGVLWGVVGISVSVLTLCIGLLWLIPFVMCFYAQFYLSLCEEKGFTAAVPEIPAEEIPVQE